MKRLIKKRIPVWVKICLGIVLVGIVANGFSFNEERLFSKRGSLTGATDFGGVSLKSGLWTEEGVKDSGNRRNLIYDRNMKALALSLKTVSVYVRPLELRERKKVVRSLSRVLGLDESELLTELRSERSFIWLKRNIDLAKAQELAVHDFSGVYLVDEWQRLYPYRQHGAHTIGFVKEGHGLAGVEFFYDNILRGELDNNSANLRKAGLKTAEIPEKGASLVLSLDIDLQILLEKELGKFLSTSNAQSASAIIMDIGTGEIYAMANLPSYDPNLFWDYQNYERKDRGLVNPVPLGGMINYIRAATELGDGSEPSPLFVDEVASRIIRADRRKKVISRDLAHSDTIWGEFGQFYYSPNFMWPEGHKPKAVKLAQMCDDLQLAEASNIDLPEDVNHQQEMDCNLSGSESRSTAVNFLKSFAWLVNAGEKVTPHLLSGLWLNNKRKLMGTDFKSATSTIDMSSSKRLFYKFVKDKMPPSYGDVAIIESISPVVSEENDKQDRIQDVKRFNTLTFGLSGQDSRMAMVVTANNALLDPVKSSPTRKMAFSILKKGEKIMASNSKSLEPVRHDQQELYAMWSDIHQKGGESVRYVPEKVVKNTMPDVKGLSLRKALQTLQGFDLQLRIVGAGQIARQFPEPGKIFENGVSCILELKMDN